MRIKRISRNHKYYSVIVDIDSGRRVKGIKSVRWSSNKDKRQVNNASLNRVYNLFISRNIEIPSSVKPVKVKPLGENEYYIQKLLIRNKEFFIKFNTADQRDRQINKIMSTPASTNGASYGDIDYMEIKTRDYVDTTFIDPRYVKDAGKLGIVRR